MKKRLILICIYALLSPFEELWRKPGREVVFDDFKNCADKGSRAECTEGCAAEFGFCDDVFVLKQLHHLPAVKGWPTWDTRLCVTCLEIAEFLASACGDVVKCMFDKHPFDQMLDGADTEIDADEAVERVPIDETLPWAADGEGCLAPGGWPFAVCSVVRAEFCGSCPDGTDGVRPMVAADASRVCPKAFRECSDPCGRVFYVESFGVAEFIGAVIPEAWHGNSAVGGSCIEDTVKDGSYATIDGAHRTKGTMEHDGVSWNSTNSSESICDIVSADVNCLVTFFWSHCCFSILE